MNKREITAFFDSQASRWDADMIRDDAVIAQILRCADIKEGVRVLDVACGTGVLIPDYLALNAAEVVGVDISSEMIRVAKGKYSDPRIKFVCADVEAAPGLRGFDRCVVYNAFPHFPNPGALIECLSRTLAEGGRLTVAHGMSRENINRHHAGCAKNVSLKLMSVDALALLFQPYFDVDIVLADDRKYIVSGIRK